jgi:restriction system protein
LLRGNDRICGRAKAQGNYPKGYYLILGFICYHSTVAFRCPAALPLSLDKTQFLSFLFKTKTMMSHKKYGALFMARRSKSPSFVWFILIMAAGGAAINFFKENSRTIEMLAPKVIIGIIVLVFLIYVSIRKAKHKKERDLEDAFRADANNFILTIETHLKVLSRKRKFLVTTDDYGYHDDSKWVAEKSTFLKKLNYKSITTDLFGGLNENYLTKLIDDSVEWYDGKNTGEIPYSNDITPFEYEQYCAYVLKQHGWLAKTTRGSGDQGVDVIAKLDGFTVAIQCKKYSSPIGNGAVQEVASGMHYWDANVAAVVTNTSYTKSARELAKSVGVLLLHHDELKDLEERLNK